MLLPWYSEDYSIKAINKLLEAGVTTNIHYVLGNNSIEEAIKRLKNNSFPVGVNAVIFLLHKPVGLGKKENVLNIDDPKVEEFFEIIDTMEQPFFVGFDSCSAPALINFSKNVDINSFDTCEAGRFSMYITSDMKALPCSFDNQGLRWAVDISQDSIESAWNSQKFEDFRLHFSKSCLDCNVRGFCLGGCPIERSIVLCNRDDKKLYV